MDEGEGSPYASAALRRAALARQRAVRAVRRAADLELLAARTGEDVFTSLAAVQRRAAACQVSSARLQESYVRRAAAWAARAPGAVRPRFMAGVAEACGTASAALTLVAADRGQLAVAASDERAERAQELEFVLDEGPARDAARNGEPVLAAGTAIARCWAGYGHALGELGVREVLSVPLLVPGGCLGALTVFDSEPRYAGSGAAAMVADALTQSMFTGPDAEPELYGGAARRDAVQQAAGMVAVQAGCRVDDALALIKARAFADGVPADSVARAVKGRRLRLDWNDGTR